MDYAQHRQTAQGMMAVHGLRAQALVQERLTESRAKGDAVELERWQAVGIAISELRQPSVAGYRGASRSHIGK